MVSSQLEKLSNRLLKHIIRCYNRLAENPRARQALKTNQPVLLTDHRLLESLDESSKKCLRNLSDVIQNQQTTDEGLHLTQGYEFSDSYKSEGSFIAHKQPQDVM